MKQFKIRCSAIGSIMSNARSKTEILSKTCTSYLDLWIKEQLYERRKEIKGKFLDKGNIMEQDALDLVAKKLGIGILEKNEKHYEDDFFTGTPDAIPGQCVVDTKCSWDFSTFPLLQEGIENKDYAAQLQGYMRLTGKKSAKLVYCLLDTPMHLIKREAYYYCINNGWDELQDKILKEHIDRMTYANIPENLKYKSFDLERDDAYIESVIERVKECRKYIDAKLITINI